MDDLHAFTIDLMNRAPVIFMATVDIEGLPQVRAVENLRCIKKFPHPAKVLLEHEDDSLISYLSINTSSKKLRQVKNNPVIALYYSIPDEYKGVMLRGKAEILDDQEFKKKLWVEGWEKYYPKGHDDPDFTILKVRPNWVKAWYRGIHEMKV
jgi:general stress protein 26